MGPCCHSQQKCNIAWAEQHCGHFPCGSNPSMPHFPPRSCFSPILCCYWSLCGGDPRLPRPTACCLGTEPQLQALQAAPQLSADPSGDGGQLGGGLHPHPLETALQRGQFLLWGQGQLIKDEGTKRSSGDPDVALSHVSIPAPGTLCSRCPAPGWGRTSCWIRGAPGDPAMGGWQAVDHRRWD